MRDRSRTRQTRRKKRVLVVEDDTDTRKMLVAAIAEEGMEAIPALDGQHALRSALAVQPNAIVLDLMLPETDGAEFARAYHRRSHSDAPIVVVSARRDADAIGERIGARAVLTKPLDLGMFIDRLKTTMRAHPTAA